MWMDGKRLNYGLKELCLSASLRLRYSLVSRKIRGKMQPVMLVVAHMAEAMFREEKGHFGTSGV